MSFSENMLICQILYRNIAKFGSSCNSCCCSRTSRFCKRLLSSQPKPEPWTHFDSKYAKEPSKDSDKKSLVKIWGGVVAFAAAAGLVLYFFDQSKKRVEKKSVLRKNLSIGKPAIGGPFQLRTLNNQIVCREDFKGKWALVYFGFTNCPDICPEELEKMSTVHEELKKLGYSSIPVFVSVDPERDTPEKIAKYLKEFHTDFVGLTGTLDEVTKVVKTFKVYFNKGPKDEDGDYIVDHSIICYLLNPSGEFVEYFGQNKTAVEMLTVIKQHISFGSQ